MLATSSNFYQYLATIVVNIFGISYGFACGWASPNVMLLLSDDSPLPTGKIDMNEASWIVALFCVGGFIGNLLFGFIAEWFGRKEPLMSTLIPWALAWLLALYAQNVYYLYAARILMGLVGGAVFVIAPLFFSEIANDSVRGLLGSTLVFSCNIGLLFEFLLGNYCEYQVAPKVVLILSTIFMVAFRFFPETPAFLFKKNLMSQAENSIRFYQNIRGKKNEQEILQAEISKLKSAFYNSNAEKVSGFKWSNFTSREACKAVMIGIVLVALNQFSGCYAMLMYTATIFKESGSNMSPNMSAIVIAVIQLVGAFCSTILVDRAGRKFLFAVSAIGNALGLICLGTYSMLKAQGHEVDSFNWVPICSFSFAVFISSWGVLTLPFLVIAEIMPEKQKNFGSSLCMSIMWLFAFIMLKFLPLLSETLGMHGSLFLFSGISLFGALFVILVLPETKGKSYEEIMQSLR